jgi:hypothetical protein
MSERYDVEDQSWYLELDEREQKEIRFALFYVDYFDHGTSGHLGYTVIAKLADKLSELTKTKDGNA